MYCPNCGQKNDSDVRFCISCGEKMKKRQVMQNINSNVSKEKTSSTNLSIISLVFLVLQFVANYIGSKVDFLSFLCGIPWLVISLILAIISKCKYNDKMSLVLIIIDCIIIGLGILFVILAIFLFVSFFETILTGCEGSYV